MSKGIRTQRKKENRKEVLPEIHTDEEYEALKDNKDAQIFLTPGGAVPNIWVDSKSKQRTTIANER